MTSEKTPVAQTPSSDLAELIGNNNPLNPFRSIHTEHLTPIFQTDAVYGVNSGQVLTTVSGSGGATATDSAFVVSTGTTVASQGIIQSRKRLRYRPGQGVVGRFAGLYNLPVANSYQGIGFGHPEDGAYFAYVDTTFGILYVNRGVREVRTLTVTVASSTNENITVKLNGTNYSVAVTNSGNIQRTVWEISQGNYGPGWTAYPSGATVVFVRGAAGTASAGAYSITASTAAGTFAQTKAGVASTDTHIPQSSWNGDKLDGTGPSKVTANWQRGNVFQIGIQYLGFGVMTFQVEVVMPSGYPKWVTVHTLRLPNSLTATSFGNPSYPFTMFAYSAGSTADISVKVGSFAGFIEGEKKLHGNRFSYFNILTTVGAANLQALFTIMNARYYGGRSNQAIITLLSAMGAIKHTSPVIYYLIKNGSLAGNPSFAQLATNSCSLWDTAATTVTYSTGDQLLWTGHLGDTGELDHQFNGVTEELTLQPGEWVTLAAKSTTGTPSYVTGSINTREDQ